jgi:peptide deformylase
MTAMALRKIRIDGDDVLRKISKPVEKFDERLEKLIGDLLDTLRHTGNGVGLAAPQLGVLRNVIVIQVVDDESPIVAINPVILSEEGEIIDKEGCLSIPDYSGDVKRPERIEVEFTDKGGEKVIYKAEGFMARVFCHEIDHLKGILFKDIALNFAKNEPLDE